MDGFERSGYRADHYMPGTRTQSGLQLIGELPWGSHLCLFYEANYDLYAILVRFFNSD